MTCQAISGTSSEPFILHKFGSYGPAFLAASDELAMRLQARDELSLHGVFIGTPITTLYHVVVRGPTFSDSRMSGFALLPQPVET